MIRNVSLSDAKSICDIYNYYILNSCITFEEELLPVKEIEQRIKSNSFQFPWLVYEQNNQVLGYAYATHWKNRSAYKYTTEVTIYLNKNATGNHIGTELYNALFAILKSKKYRTLIAGIALPNKISIALHEKLGFKKVAHFKNIGYKFNKWIDVAYWQLELT